MAFLSVRTYYHLLAKDLNIINLISVLNVASKTKQSGYQKTKQPLADQFEFRLIDLPVKEAVSSACIKWSLREE